MQTIAHCVRKVLKATRRDHYLNDYNYRKPQRAFSAIMDVLRARRSLPTAAQLNCLYLALRWERNCGWEAKCRNLGKSFSSKTCVKLLPLFQKHNRGVVGGGQGSIERRLTHKGNRTRFWHLLSHVYNARDAATADMAVRDFARNPVSGLGVGVTSPLLWGLKPEWYPIVNGGSEKGLSEIFVHFRFPETLDQYLILAGRLRDFSRDSGLLSFSRLDRLLRGIDRFKWTFSETERLQQGISSEDRLIRDIDEINASHGNGKTEKNQLVLARIGQGRFREAVLKMWKGCSITACSALPLLRASHIKPWSECDNKERLDPYNGLLLVPNLDEAFDNGFISFDAKGCIMVSSMLEDSNAAILGIMRNMRITPHSKHLRYLAYHRSTIFKK